MARRELQASCIVKRPITGDVNVAFQTIWNGDGQDPCMQGRKDYITRRVPAVVGIVGEQRDRLTEFGGADTRSRTADGRQRNGLLPGPPIIRRYVSLNKNS